MEMFNCMVQTNSFHVRNFYRNLVQPRMVIYPGVVAFSRGHHSVTHNIESNQSHAGAS